jgi:uncharacterized protein involved in exopolysaccharide biosynthesis
MITKIDTRSVLTAFFRQQRKFFAVFLSIFGAGIIYILLATPGYESTAKLLIKFGQDARPAIQNQNANADISSADEHREIVQSNVNILSSRDLAEALLNEISLERAYPGLTSPAHGTLMDAAFKQYSDDLVIKTASDSDIINVGLYNQDPIVAKAMLRRLLDLFIARQSEIYGNPQTAIL